MSKLPTKLYMEEAGVGERGRECESEIYTYISFTFNFNFKCTFLKKNSFYALYTDEKDLFDLIWRDCPQYQII